MGWEDQERDELGRFGASGTRGGMEESTNPDFPGPVYGGGIGNPEPGSIAAKARGGPSRPEDVTRGVASNDSTKSARAALKGIEKGQLWKRDDGEHVTVDWTDEESGDVIATQPSRTRGMEDTIDRYRMPADTFRARHTQVKRAVHKPLGWDLR